MTQSTITRRYPRIKAPQSAVVAWKTPDRQDISRVRTIALGGLFIQTKNPPKVGSTLQMLIVTPRGQLRVRAHVRNVIAGEGMGVAIVSMDTEDRGKLDQWLKQLSEMDPGESKRGGWNVAVRRKADPFRQERNLRSLAREVKFSARRHLNVGQAV